MPHSSGRLGDALQLTLRSTGCLHDTVLHNNNHIISSYLGWWQDAGLNDAVSDNPSPWLQESSPPSAISEQAIAANAPTATAPFIDTPVRAAKPMPSTLDAFDQWLQSPENLPFLHWSTRPVLPTGPANPDLMLLAAFPEEADIEAGELFAGAQGALIDGMLKAIDLERSQQRIASLAFTRPPTQRLNDDETATLMGIARHHVALVRPKILILLGPQLCQLVSGRTIVPTAEDQPIINHIAPKTDAFAVHHPHMLIERPQLKRHAWEVLKRVRELI